MTYDKDVVNVNEILCFSSPIIEGAIIPPFGWDPKSRIEDTIMVVKKF